MITREDIVTFYEQYKKNLDEENALLETLSSVESETAWIKRTVDRKKRFDELYEENMAMLNSCIFPLINHETEFTDEIAEEIIIQASQYSVEGYTDGVASFEIVEEILKYYKKKEDNTKYIEALHILVFSYLEQITYECVERALELVREEAGFAERYFEFEQWSTRRKILMALYNHCVTIVNYITPYRMENEEEILLYQKEFLESVKKAEEFYSDAKIRELDGDKIDFDELIDSLANIACCTCISDLGIKVKTDQELLKYATEKIEEQYHRKVNDEGEEQLISNIACGYLITQYRSGLMPLDEFASRYFSVCRRIIENNAVVDKKHIEESFYYTDYFNVCAYRLPFFLQYLHNDEIDEKLREEIVGYSIEKYLDLLDWIPHFRNSLRVSSILEQSAFELIRNSSHSMFYYYFILKVVINRDEKIMIHSTMVRKISNILVNYIMRERPEILIGIYDTESVVDVLSKQDEIVEYVRAASLLYDVGMIHYSNLVGRETRELLESEINRIKRHPADGYFMTKDIGSMACYKDIILGHHKSYDGRNGYPEEFDNTKSKIRAIIDIIKISDCMETACESYGRKNHKTQGFFGFLEELRNMAGTEYNPFIAELILNDSKLQDELIECCINGRDKVYYETYHEFFKNHLLESKPVDSRQIPSTNNARNSIHNFVIDFYKDSVETMYYGKDCIINERISCGFKEFINDKVMPITHPEDKAKLEIFLNYGGFSDRFNANNGSFEVEVRIMKNGEWRWHRLYFVVVEEQHGIPERILLTFDDMNIEIQRKYQIQLELEKAKEEAKRANSAKTMFISNISHEIRTPMNAIIGMVEIMLREQMPESQKGYLMNIRNSGNALLSIINDILDFSKMESGKLEIIEDEYELMSLLSDLSMIFLNRIGEKNVELIFDIDKNIPELLYGDVGRIRQVVINIMNNAIKFTDQGTVSLKMEVKAKVDDMIELGISVKDTGIGIKKEEIPKLFRAFQQVDIKRNRQMEGTGLGLVISKQLVELMGGSISVESEYGKGTEFYFTIEQKVLSDKNACSISLDEKERENLLIGGNFDNQALEESIDRLCEMYGLRYTDISKESNADVNMIFCDSVKLAETKSKYSDRNVKICAIQNPMMESLKDNDIRIVNKPLYSINFCHIISNEEDKAADVRTDEGMNFIAPDAKILIVDDTEMNLTVAKGLLQPLKMQIDTADNGKTAIEMLQKKHYDLVFMDHKMPVMDGIEATMLIRNIEGKYYQEVPIIALTANAVMDARESFMQAGMNDFVAKPIEMKAICSKIRKWLPKNLIVKRSSMTTSTYNVDQMSIPAIKGIDIQEGVRNSGSIELFETLLHDYYKLIDVKTAKVMKLLEEGNIHDYTIEVHALKSTSRMIGALKLSEKFKQLEEWGDKNMVENIYQENDKVMEEYQAYKVYLKDFVTLREKESVNTDKDEISPGELIEILEAICTSITDCDLDILDQCMERLDKCAISEPISEQMEKLKIAAADFAMEEIVSIAKDIISELKK